MFLFIVKYDILFRLADLAMFFELGPKPTIKVDTILIHIT